LNRASISEIHTWTGPKSEALEPRFENIKNGVSVRSQLGVGLLAEAYRAHGLVAAWGGVTVGVEVGVALVLALDHGEAISVAFARPRARVLEAEVVGRQLALVRVKVCDALVDTIRVRRQVAIFGDFLVLVERFRPPTVSPKGQVRCS